MMMKLKTLHFLQRIIFMYTSSALGNRIYVFIYCSVITEVTKHFKNMLQQGPVA